MIMKNKTLSILIPAYNAGKYIGECLKSLENFILDNIQVIVINDGSTDDTVSKVEEYCRRDPRIEIITIQNGGVSKARNVGLEHASGEYIMFLDADDYLLVNAFTDLNRVLNGSDIDFAAFSRKIIQEGKDSWNDKFCFDVAETTDKNIVDQIMYADSHFNECWGKLYKKDIIKNHNIRFPEGIPIGEDMMFVMEYYEHCNSVFVSNNPLVAYRQHGQSAMRKYGLLDRLHYTEELYEFTKEHAPINRIDTYWFYNFKILTNLCREYSSERIDRNAIYRIYDSKMALEVANNLRMNKVPSYRIHEVLLMKKKLYTLSALYYHIKANKSR